MDVRLRNPDRTVHVGGPCTVTELLDGLDREADRWADPTTDDDSARCAFCSQQSRVLAVLEAS